MLREISGDVEVTEPTFDADGYPTEETLEAIRDWDCVGRKQRDALLAFVKKAWRYADSTWAVGPEGLCVSTYGWSGNESLVSAMQENHVFWSLVWKQSNRGGHFVFEDRYP